jgi:hypothetical protein
MRAVLRRLLWYALPLALFAPDAHAWGLQSHLIFAHYALLMMPFADPRLRAAAARFPRLVLAGACLPDLALTGGLAGTPAFRRTHRWSTLRRISAVPRDDADRALLLGYASHLVTDVVAHNHFVPEHEMRIVRVPYAVHAAAEWAMDDYLRREFPARPGELMAENHAVAADFAARAFRCDPAVAARALRLLERADRLLRASALPALCGALLHLSDRDLTARFNAYLRRATSVLHGIEAAMAGALVDWQDSDPEGHPSHESADAGPREDVARIMQSQHDP